MGLVQKELVSSKINAVNFDTKMFICSFVCQIKRKQMTDVNLNCYCNIAILEII